MLNIFAQAANYKESEKKEIEEKDAIPKMGMFQRKNLLSVDFFFH